MKTSQQQYEEKLSRSRGGGFSRPIQKISLKEKLKVPEDLMYPPFITNTAQYYINQCDFNTQVTEIIDIIKSINEDINEDEYSYVTKPYVSLNTQGQQRLLPARMRNYDIITPIKNALVAERSERANLKQVITRNKDLNDEVEGEIKSALTQNLVNDFVNRIKKYGLAPEIEEQEVKDYQGIVSAKTENINDYRASQGQDVLDIIYVEKDLEDKYQELFDSWFDVGIIVTYKNVHRDDIDYEVIKPYDYFTVGGKSQYGEDHEAGVRKFRWTLSDVVDAFRSDLKEEDIIWLESKISRDATISNSQYVYLNQGETLSNNTGYITGFHVVWKSFKEVIIVTYQDEFGRILQREEQEGYKLNKETGDIKIKSEWINEVWEDWVIEDKLHLRYRPIIAQRNEVNNSSICKLPYNRKLYNSNTTKINSLGKIGLTFQKLYNIFHYRFEHTMAKNKDKLMLMPLGIIPKGWDRSKFMYFADSTGFAWFDETNENLPRVLNALKSIDMSLGKYASEMINFMSAVKQEWWEYVGMNPQRFGNVKASAGKATTEQAILRSSILTEELNRKFDKYLEKEYQGLLDLAKYAYVNGKKGAFITSEGYRKLANIDGPSLINSDLGVHAKNSAVEANKLNEIKMLSQSAMQNGYTLSDMIDLHDSNNIARIKLLVKKGEAIQQKLQQQQQESEQNALLQKEEMITKRHEDIQAHEVEITAMKIEGDITTALISAESSAYATYTSAETANKPVDVSDKLMENVIKNREILFKEMQEQNKLRNEEANRTLKREEIKSNERIARMNKN